MNEFLNSRNVCDPSWVPIQKYTSEEDRVSTTGSVFDTIFNDKNDARNDTKSDTKYDTFLGIGSNSNSNNNNNRKFGTNTTTSTTTGTSTPLGTNVNNNNINALSLPSSPSGSNINNFTEKLKYTALSEKDKNTNNTENIWGINEIQEESLDIEKSMIRSKSISTIQEISKDDHYVTDDARTYVQPTESRRAVSQLILPLRDRALSEMHTNTPRMHALIVEVSNLHRTGNTFAILMLLYCAVV